MELFKRQNSFVSVITVTFFLSGFSSLVYQIIWQRYISFFVGSDTIASTITVAAFLAGLGLGNLWGGYLADSASNTLRLGLFALAELGLCVFGLCTKTIFYDWMYGSTLIQFSDRSYVLLLLFMVLLIPSTLMGLTLPLLSKTFTAKGLDITKSVGTLYSTNTFGACFGAFITTLIILPLYGFDRGYLVAFGINFLVASTAGWYILKEPKENDPDKLPETFTQKKLEWSPEFMVWLPIYFLSGFIAIALEIIWFRLCGNIIKSDSYSYGIILSFYLMGLALGGIMGTWLSKKGNANVYFLGLQGIVPSLAMALILGFLVLASQSINFLGLHTHLQNYDTTFHIRNLVILYGFVPCILILLPTMVMGATFPLMQQTANQSFESLGRKMGWLLLSNIGGNILGAFLTTFVLLEFFGTSMALKLLCIASIFFIILLYSKAKIVASVLYMITLAFVLFFYDNPTLYSKVQATSKEKLLLVERASGVSSIKYPENQASLSVVYSNNLGQSWLPYTGGDIHLLLGAAPVLFHPNPKKIAIIGLGSGCTLFGAAGRESLEKIVCFEIMEGQKEMLTQYGNTGYLPAIQLLKNPKIQFKDADGRYELYKSDQKFDIIEADALRPTSAYSGNLYSIEYFQLLRRKLNPGGIAVTWAPTERIYNAFCSTFPYVYDIGGILFGSESPMKKNGTENFICEAYSQSYFSNAGIDIVPLAAQWFNQLKPVAQGSWDKNIVNTDLYPVDELYRSRISKIFQ
ncbi:MAG: fused MFS/spermidine synthase [Cytophagales bacterium]|nr:fused MFS/spermidine synthase [Cytophagales bacterium]